MGDRGRRLNVMHWSYDELGDAFSETRLDLSRRVVGGLRGGVCNRVKK